MDKKYIALIGAAVVIVGLFLPVASSTNMSTALLIQGEGVSWQGAVVLLLALIGAVLAFMGRTKHAVWPGIAVIGLLAWSYFDAQGRLDRMAAMISGPDVPPDFAAMLSQRLPHLNLLGWGVMGAGALLMIVAGAMAWKGSAEAPPPAAA
ncbi:MAG TPA: hypothetical protein VEC11_06305 [Allosphingosinicella sp.]|nr:hypothetical protein [Allosphingosinicella sp.]